MYKLFIYTPNAEYIFKAIHWLTHSAVVTMLANLAYSFFKRHSSKA